MSYIFDQDKCYQCKNTSFIKIFYTRWNKCFMLFEFGNSSRAIFYIHFQMMFSHLCTLHLSGTQKFFIFLLYIIFSLANFYLYSLFSKILLIYLPEQVLPRRPQTTSLCNKSLRVWTGFKHSSTVSSRIWFNSCLSENGDKSFTEKWVSY